MTKVKESIATILAHSKCDSLGEKCAYSCAFTSNVANCLNQCNNRVNQCLKK